MLKKIEIDKKVYIVETLKGLNIVDLKEVEIIVGTPRLYEEKVYTDKIASLIAEKDSVPIKPTVTP